MTAHEASTFHRLICSPETCIANQERQSKHLDDEAKYPPNIENAKATEDAAWLEGRVGP